MSAWRPPRSAPDRASAGHFTVRGATQQHKRAYPFLTPSSPIRRLPHTSHTLPLTPFALSPFVTELRARFGDGLVDALAAPPRDVEQDDFIMDAIMMEQEADDLANPWGDLDSEDDD